MYNIGNMRKFIENFHEQLKYRPVIQGLRPIIGARAATAPKFESLLPTASIPELQTIPRYENIGTYQRIIIAGMGGSALAGILLKDYCADLEVIVHRDYGLPRMAQEKLGQSLVIANSYSGNTEETIDAFETAIGMGIHTIAIATGGKLLEIAKKGDTPYIQIPMTGAQPRLALGLSVVAILKAIGREEDLSVLYELQQHLRASDFEQQGATIAKELGNKIPIIYASERNRVIPYLWKINFNETAKIPAFFNAFPELNHNEMSGFDAQPSTKALSDKFAVILLSDKEDNPRIQKRMEVFKKMLDDRGLPIHRIELQGKNFFEKVFSSMILSEWTAYHLGTNYGVETEQVPMIEEFKKLI